MLQIIWDSGSIPLRSPAAALAVSLMLGRGSICASTSDLAKESQNPGGNLVSLPFQNTTSFGIGPDDARSNALSLKPVYPTLLSGR